MKINAVSSGTRLEEESRVKPSLVASFECRESVAGHVIFFAAVSCANTYTSLEIPYLSTLGRHREKAPPPPSSSLPSQPRDGHIIISWRHYQEKNSLRSHFSLLRRTRGIKAHFSMVSSPSGNNLNMMLSSLSLSSTTTIIDCSEVLPPVAFKTRSFKGKGWQHSGAMDNTTVE